MVKRLKCWTVQARQFGQTMVADTIPAKDRDTAIKKFKKKHYVSRGYMITAQKSKRCKKTR